MWHLALKFVVQFEKWQVAIYQAEKLLLCGKKIWQKSETEKARKTRQIELKTEKYQSGKKTWI